MIKIEAVTLEEAFNNAATSLKCSVTELSVEVVQVPNSGFLGFFKKSAIIVATIKKETKTAETVEKIEPKMESKAEKKTPSAKQNIEVKENKKEAEKEKFTKPTMLNDTIMPTSFVSDQDEQDEDLGSGLDYTADYDDEYDDEYDDDNEEHHESKKDLNAIAQKVRTEINELFKMVCFEIDDVEVSAYDDETILIEFKGADAALLIGKEGYRYKALSYMLFNWINSKYEVQLRLEIAEFLKNQEESVSRYLENVYENIERDGRAQTKILDGVLVQIALKELREKYPQKYVVIRSTKDGLKYIIVNDYHNN